MIKKIIKKIIWGKRYSSESYIAYLRKIGVEIGEDCTIYVPTKTLVDEQYPWMITIGNHVRITEGVKILTHDYAWSVIKLAESSYKGAILGASGKVQIGDNVFIGMNTIITRGVTIGRNVIIGAGSVVTKDCIPNSVYAGNPAKYIMSLDEYINKRSKMQKEEAKELVRTYYARYKCKPHLDDLHEYFMLFSNVEQLYSSYQKKMSLCNNFNDSIQYMKKNKPIYESYDVFINECLGDGILDE